MKINELTKTLMPPPKWRWRVFLLMGVLFGFLLVILRISNAVSYLSDNPDTCMNCHVMTPQYATWERSSHARVATCNDCHVPHDNIFRTYMFKAQDGLRHATIFTLHMEPEVIRIKEAGRKVVQDNCIRCHSSFLHISSLTDMSGELAESGDGRYCWDCHRETPHGRVNSLSSFPFARVPGPHRVLPEWIEKNFNQNSK